MKLSIIIVSYNERKYLSEALESCILNGIDYEIIIGDDGSTDGSLAVIKDYCERYPSNIRYFVMDRNDTGDIIPSIRVSNILKRAFKECRGEYITVMSGDDINTIPNRYLKQVEFLDNNLQFNSVYIDYKKFWDDGYEENYECKSTINESVLWATKYIHISCYVFRRICLENILNRFCDDTGLLYSILISGKSKHLRLNGFGYRQRKKSIMHDSDRLELCLLEIALFQDCLNHGKWKFFSFSRFARPLYFLLKHRKFILDPKYKKYRITCQKYDNDIITLVLKNHLVALTYSIIGYIFYCVCVLFRKGRVLQSILVNER